MSLPPEVQRLIEGKIDFEGQKLVEQVSRNALLAITSLSYIIGLVSQSLTLTFGSFGVGTLILLVVALPQWPMYNRNPVQWLPPVDTKKKQ
ncbi:uncharacterized protein STEHIDRAFT_158438 [Stereum hirsutum FP-91666 SS1]|uniref:uncharacterized protein n=1 Tax=Stereum hirsutum (strain FP-91666) TaxID=721885 RepID=UPI0004449EC3|nr:uncharacterized protein STEHIDRAFT_158438 [Stereum hirsutum FP-91666 SS1]EIM84722.1 hypothetical protein STEHIDRAFT_158438 [Stereum hirsutum FP-91666 SS1]